MGQTIGKAQLEASEVSYLANREYPDDVTKCLINNFTKKCKVDVVESTSM